MDGLGLVMDLLLLLFLAAMIFVGWNLTRSINLFRKSRKELDKLVQDLSRQIERADHAVAGLKNASREAGNDLQTLIGQSRALADELKLMTESGDSLASRLERLAERNRDIAERIERAGGSASGVPVREPALPRPQEDKRAATGPLGFAIRDRDLEEGNPDDDGDDDNDGNNATHSRAERALMEALRKTKTQAGGV